MKKKVKTKQYLASIEIPIGDYMGHQIFKSREDAQRWCDNWNSQITQEEVDDEETNIEWATVIEINI